MNTTDNLSRQLRSLASTTHDAAMIQPFRDMAKLAEELEARSLAQPSGNSGELHPPSGAVVEAAKAVLNRWDDPQWEWAKHGHTAGLIADLRKSVEAAPSGPTVDEQTEKIIEEVGFAFGPTPKSFWTGDPDLDEPILTDLRNRVKDVLSR